MASRRGSSFPSNSQGPFVGHELLEDQNEQMESHLKDKVSQLNDIAIKIGMELKDQENLTNGLNDSFNNLSSNITNTTGRVGKACLYPLTPWDPVGPSLDLLGPCRPTP